MVGVVTNLVVALKITTTTMVPCACPDGIDGCLVAHYKEVTTTDYQELKTPTNVPCANINTHDIGGFYNIWTDGGQAMTDAGATGTRIYPIRIHTGLPGVTPLVGSRRIVGCLHYGELAKAMDEIRQHRVTVEEKEKAVTKAAGVRTNDQKKVRTKQDCIRCLQKRTGLHCARTNEITRIGIGGVGTVTEPVTGTKDGQ